MSIRGLLADFFAAVGLAAPAILFILLVFIQPQ